MWSYQHKDTSPPNNNYHVLLRRISKSLSKEELRYISQQPRSAGIQNKTNFNGTVLFKFFEHQMLITHDNLDYLRSCLQSIRRIDLCKLIDDYTNNYLNPQSPHVVPHLQPYSEPHPQSLYAEPQQQSSYVQPHYGELDPQSYVERRPHSSYKKSQPYVKSYSPTEFCCHSKLMLISLLRIFVFVFCFATISHAALKC